MTGWDTRAQAGLRAPRAISTNVNPTAGVGCHYGGGGPFKRSDHDACRAIWRSWQDYHMSPSNANNYIDIAYNLGACHHDIVLEGRSTRSRPIVRGGANGNATVNYNRYSVVAIWGSNDGDWPDSLKRAWRHGRDWLRQQDRRTGSGLTPHRDMSSTACPGGPGTAWFRAGAPLPGGTTPPSPQEDDMEITDRVPLSEGTQPNLGGQETLSVGGLLGYAGGGGFRYMNDRVGLLTNQAKALTELAAIKAAVGGQVDETALAQQIAALLIPVISSEFEGLPGVTLEAIEAANERATRRVLGSLDE